ncbi:MAG: hypothetical protein IM473_14215 [Microcystis sp. M015S2]|uniref:hypothetical protein n=1 Tax=unclassified Microcystis TaxID=2643300 RepID=UPI00258D87BE|nr:MULTISPECIES: hypothetical protein [unclassified Microcystis]MCA2709185.1 hypothetical protein [Microcystis sp. M025S2]MCA2743520.1 hypothetical protein [Microcystis sp. M015S2]
MIPIQVNTWGPNNFDFGGRGEFASRVESGNEPMQWVGTSSHSYFAVEYRGTVRQGQLSGARWKYNKLWLCSYHDMITAVRFSSLDSIYKATLKINET